MFFRPYTLVASAFLFIYGVAWLVFDARLRADPAAERALCYAGLCDNEGLLKRALQSLNSPPASAAADNFREALQRTPDAPLLWCEMGEVERRAGRIDQARFCYGRAHALAPNNPFILWQLVTAEISVGDQRLAFAYASDVLRHTRLFDQTVFGYFAAMKTPVPVFLHDILPQNAEAARSYLRFLIQRGDVAGAMTVWDAILSGGYIDAALANEQVAFLLNGHRPELAARVWAGYLGNRAGDFGKTNVLFNGDFEWKPSGALLDWNILAVSGAQATLDSTTHFSGDRALRICFDGADFNFFDHVWQVFAIDAGVYRIEAYVQSQNLDPGVQLRILSWPEEQALRVLTPAAPEGSGWKRIQAEFTVPRNVEMARIDVIHQAAVLADQKMGGCAWLDGVRLQRIR